MVSHEESMVADAIGHFEYRFEDGGLVTPRYKYVYLETGQFPVLPIFQGRDTDNPIHETGFIFRFDTFDFWGVNVPVNQGYRVEHFLSGGVTRLTSGFITGMINPSEKSGFFTFNLDVPIGDTVRRVEGYFILKQAGAVL
ncbi:MULTISPECIES: hypothetical protein [Pseudomonas]|jgi:hypothetical protein|uniref:hypothetical protein n=1 Tax=Pseudomonas TaxID=286 RepID=UPI000812536D|nr:MULTISPECIES: hypothetical protein [Pseudomonas]WJM90580.1 hypothetical protein QDY63_24985 [Pseudomonas brenneri]CRM82968.1 hypothetical protein [Pseudomonas sp. 25 R 14]